MTDALRRRPEHEWWWKMRLLAAGLPQRRWALDDGPWWAMGTDVSLPKSFLGRAFQRGQNKPARWSREGGGDV
jgi:hypothetical protein